MLIELLIIFIILTFILLFLSIYVVEENPKMSIPLIMSGLILSITCTFSLWDVEFFYVGYDSTAGNSTAYLYSTSYGEPWSYIFMLMFFIFFILFFRAGFNMWIEALETQGEMNYRLKK